MRTISLHDFTKAKVLSVPDPLSLSGEHRIRRSFLLVVGLLAGGGR